MSSVVTLYDLPLSKRSDTVSDGGCWVVIDIRSCLLLVCSVMMKWPTTKREVGETSKPGRAWARALARKVARGGWYGDN